jgi:hypothetical protein
MPRERKPPSRFADEEDDAPRKNKSSASHGPKKATKKQKKTAASGGVSDEDSSREGRAKRSQRRPRDPMKPLGYALRLSEYHNYGTCGVDEAEDGSEAVEAKVSELSRMILEAPHVTVHTGAGISTSAGIPDFRGIGGVWTRHQRGEPLPAGERCWNNAQPTICHMALAALVEAGRVDAIITQNIDGLHVRSGGNIEVAGARRVRAGTDPFPPPPKFHATNSPSFTETYSLRSAANVTG